MKYLKRILIGIVGGAVFAVGVAMILLPGPAVLDIPAGLAILAIEFVWARRWLRSFRAVMPRRDAGELKPRKMTMQSFRRSMEFLARQVRRTFSRQKERPDYSVIVGPASHPGSFLACPCGQAGQPALSLKR